MITDGNAVLYKCTINDLQNQFMSYPFCVILYYNFFLIADPQARVDEKPDSGHD